MMLSCQVQRVALCVMMVLSSASAYGSNECTEEKVTECVNMVVRHTDMADMLTKSNAEEMRATCRTYDKFVECIEPVQPQCGNALMLIIENIENGFSFLCEKKNLDEYLKHADCFTKMHLDESAAPCITALLINMLAAKGSKTRVCKIIGDYVNCIVKPVSSNCGDDAARYMRSVLVQFMKPSLDLIDCDISGAAVHSSTFEDITAYLLQSQRKQ